MTDVYLVVHKDSAQKTTCFFASKDAFTEAEGLMQDHGGTVIVLELDPEEVAKRLLNDWVSKVWV